MTVHETTGKVLGLLRLQKCCQINPSVAQRRPADICVTLRLDQKLPGVQHQVSGLRGSVVGGGAGAAPGVDAIQKHWHRLPGAMGSGDLRQKLLSVGSEVSELHRELTQLREVD
jgi:hypothetical protein